MSICDTCPKPGYCCNNIRLHSSGVELIFWDDEDTIEQLTKLSIDKLPFVPKDKTGTWFTEAGRAYSEWTFSCPNLNSAGRCDIYETRPKLCRTYEPGSDALCILYKG